MSYRKTCNEVGNSFPIFLLICHDSKFLNWDLWTHTNKDLPQLYTCEFQTTVPQMIILYSFVDSQFTGKFS